MMFSNADCPGFSVTGNVMPEKLNPAPLSAPELIVRGCDPVELICTDCVAVVFTATFPNATLVDAMVHAAPVPLAPLGLSCSVTVTVLFQVCAVIVTVCGELTAAIVAENVTLLDPEGTFTGDGTCTAGLSVERLMLRPLLRCTVPLIAMVHASVPAPENDDSAHEMLLMLTAAEQGRASSRPPSKASAKIASRGREPLVPG